MVNKLGQMARGLQSYHQAQSTPVEGVKHETPEDMKDTDGWRLCEMGLITKTIDDLLRDVKKINEETPELEDKRQAATKGLIKRKAPCPTSGIPLTDMMQSTPRSLKSSVSLPCTATLLRQPRPGPIFFRRSSSSCSASSGRRLCASRNR